MRPFARLVVASALALAACDGGSSLPDASPADLTAASTNDLTPAAADLAASDLLASPFDLSPVEDGVDAAPPVDLATAADAAVPADLAAGADLAVAADLASTDAGAKDMAASDAARPDLATPDLAMPDLWVPTPSVTAVSPAQGPTSGGTTITITGSNFAPSATVTVDGLPASGVSVDSATQITATTPADPGHVGRVQIVVANSSTVSASGGFRYYASQIALGAPVAYASSANVSLDTAVGDFNHDGNPDIAAIGTDCVVLLGKGDGTFTVVPVATLGGPSRIAVGDLDGDQRDDLVTADGSGNVVASLGDGTGHFGAPLTTVVAGGSSLAKPALGDVDGDHVLDVIVADGSASVYVATGKGDGRFVVALTLSDPSGPSGVALVDVNGDGYGDPLAGNTSASSFRLWVSSGPKQFTGVANYSNPSPVGQVAWGDLDGDGIPDLVLGTSGGGTRITTRHVYGGTQPQPLGPGRAADAMDSADFVGTGDFDGDGVNDLVGVSATASNVSILRGHGDLTFEAPVKTPVGNSPATPAVADFNGDGLADVALANQGVTGTAHANVAVLLNASQ